MIFYYYFSASMDHIEPDLFTPAKFRNKILSYAPDYELTPKNVLYTLFAVLVLSLVIFIINLITWYKYGSNTLGTFTLSLISSILIGCGSIAGIVFYGKLTEFIIKLEKVRGFLIASVLVGIVTTLLSATTGCFSCILICLASLIISIIVGAILVRFVSPRDDTSANGQDELLIPRESIDSTPVKAPMSKEERDRDFKDLGA